MSSCDFLTNIHHVQNMQDLIWLTSTLTCVFIMCKTKVMSAYTDPSSVPYENINLNCGMVASQSAKSCGVVISV
jgi:hypothetical protein